MACSFYRYYTKAFIIKATPVLDMKMIFEHLWSCWMWEHCIFAPDYAHTYPHTFICKPDWIHSFLYICVYLIIWHNRLKILAPAVHLTTFDNLQQYPKAILVPVYIYVKLLMHIFLNRILFIFIYLYLQCNCSHRKLI